MKSLSKLFKIDLIPVALNVDVPSKVAASVDARTPCNVENGLCLTHGFSVSALVKCSEFPASPENWKEKYELMEFLANSLTATGLPSHSFLRLQPSERCNYGVDLSREPCEQCDRDEKPDDWLGEPDDEPEEEISEPWEWGEWMR